MLDFHIVGGHRQSGEAFLCDASSDWLWPLPESLHSGHVCGDGQATPAWISLVFPSPVTLGRGPRPVFHNLQQVHLIKHMILLKEYWLSKDYVL